MLHLLALLIALDALTTIVGVRRGLAEANPLIGWLVKAIGLVPALLITHAGMIAAAYGFGFEGLALWACTGIYGAVLAINLARLG